MAIVIPSDEFSNVLDNIGDRSVQIRSLGRYKHIDVVLLIESVHDKDGNAIDALDFIENETTAVFSEISDPDALHREEAAA
jgi:hypothetical protein